METHRCKSMPRNAQITVKPDGRCLLSVYVGVRVQNDYCNELMSSGDFSQRVFFCPFCGAELEREEVIG